MKALGKIILWSLLIALSSVLTLLLVIFFRPDLLINPTSLTWAINSSGVFQEWSWKNAQTNFQWKKWNKRGFNGEFQNFCFVFENEAQKISSCFPEISWNLMFSFHFKGGLNIKALHPVLIESSLIEIIPKNIIVKDDAPSDPVDVWTYWKIFWSNKVPDFEVKLQKIVFKDFDFSVELARNGKNLSGKLWEILLSADPAELRLGLPEGWEIPKKTPLASPLRFYSTSLIASIEKSKVDLELEGNLSPLKFNIQAFVDLPLVTPGSDEFIRKILLTTICELSLEKIKETLKTYSPHPYNSLPAPFNVMNGYIKSRLAFREMDNNKVQFYGSSLIDLKGKKQFFKVGINHEIPLLISDWKPKAITLAIDFKKIFIQLPRLSKTSLPPQFLPDSRIKKKLGPVSKKKMGVPLHLSMVNDTPLMINSNLLDEVLRLNFDLLITSNGVDKGYLDVLPLKTTIFKRPIKLQKLRVRFQGQDPALLNGLLIFPLPEYEITLKLEGPTDQIRMAMSSEPPLPESDIYAVLLFGRPMSALGQEDKEASGNVGQLMAQGVLSLSVLYYLSGSPVEYVGLDPDSKNAVAQIGLGSKNSLRVEGQKDISSVGVRRSLGKGWYIDTSVQDASDLPGSEATNYGVLLERVISY